MKYTNCLSLITGLLILIQGNVTAQSNSEVATVSEELMGVELLTYRGSVSRTWDLLHTELAVSFDWERRYLYGIATLDLKPLFYEQESLVLDAKGMDIKTLSVNGAPTDFEYDGWKIWITFNQAYSRKDTIQVSIAYTAKPYEREVGGSEAIEENRGLYFINADGSDPNKPQQIWTQGETEANSGWFPTIDIPNERSTQKMKITVQDKFKTLSNGLLTEQIKESNGKRTDIWVMDQAHPPYLFMMAVGDFSVTKDEWNGVPLAYWMENDFGEYGKDIFRNTPEMMTFFSEILGYPYPWKKYDQIVVRDYVSGAMENTSASLFYEQLNVDSRYLIDDNWDAIIAHELMHQWFGDLVTCESWSNLALNEGFASYAEYLWNQYKYGQDEADYTFLVEQEIYFIEAAETPKNLIRYYYDDQEDMFDSHSYNKGAAVLHMLRSYLGDDAFFLGLNNYLEDHAFESVEVAQLRLAFEKVTGEDLNWFFDQWFFFAGHPELEVRHKYENDTLTLTVEQTQSHDEMPIFQLPVFVDIWQGDKLASFPIVVNEAYETYQFPMDEKPDVVIFDSERQLLGIIDHPKTEQEYYTQFVKDGSLYSRIETLDSLYSFKDKKLIDQILREAIKDPFYMVRQYALEYLMDEEVKLKKYEIEIIPLLKDSSSRVRSYALAYLGIDGFEKYRSEFDKALNDSSYIVVASGISQFTANEVELPASFLVNQKDVTNLNVVIMLAEYYLYQEHKDSFDWYQNRMTGLDGNTLFYFIQAYAEKLLDAPDQYRKAAVLQFEEVARKNANYMARFSAYQALVLMSDMEGIEAKLKDIRENEKDERLIELYEGI
ncbi:aminopeptidase N [Reichenbachiella faecimaris]|uniref:Aminopeptidase N n=1 Tax=Reichenbachiella faecimaris TaxID=692418 RepID=A0A1W2GJN3_REIFA|nr:M1 family metallopeptidase [Reichenbachiella faecimaris]SMD36548.1 aminopeptidase N [Reichenbachiella faecimaris]